jgi:hypothetical protein
MARHRDLFTTIRTEGSLLPSDLLSRIAANDTTVDGLRPADYHLINNERIGEIVNRSWNRMAGAWDSYEEALSRLPKDDPGTTVTRERWLLVLLQELGFGRLTPSGGITVDGRAFPVSHEWVGRVPIHLVGSRIDLDRRTPGVAGASRSSPHSLVQELLNASSLHLWGIVSNGLRLRVLRDNAALTRQAYVEFDLQAMMEGQVYPDFVLLWLLAHQSRFELDESGECWLERWAKTAEAQGTRALDTLRDGVQAAIEDLGSGFLQHPANDELRNTLRDGRLETLEYYRILLRLIYRFLFLLVSEDRDLLLLPDSAAPCRKLYLTHYSMSRVRRISERRSGTAHADLYEGLKIVMAALAHTGEASLALPALGSTLWATESIGQLATARLGNRALLAAVAALSFTSMDGVRRWTDYGNLGSEELGSIYESLLELTPDINLDLGAFALVSRGGHERRSTSSFYTHTALIAACLDTTLDPLMDQAVRSADPTEALLSLRILDPACGSGHFLVAAAHRLAKRVATSRTGEVEPSPHDVRTALRAVIGRCLYGVDLNSMAVELCKVSLWLEALTPGKPLSFLDHRIVRGNAVVGATPRMLARGIPDDAYKALIGDESNATAGPRKRNALERDGQRSLLFAAASADASPELRALAGRVDDVSDDDITATEEKSRRLEEWRSSTVARRERLAADAWCAAYLLPKQKGQLCVTTDMVRAIREDFAGSSADVHADVARVASDYGVFHWHLEFPHVFSPDRGGVDADTGWHGGFDLVLGNPPWKSMSPDVREFFSAYDPAIRDVDKAGQELIMTSLLEDAGIRTRWDEYRRKLYAQAHFFKTSGRFQLFAPGNFGKGDFDIFRMFVETVLQTARPGGMCTQVVKAGFYNSPNCMAIRQRLFANYEWTHLIACINTGGVWFRGVHAQTTFCIYAAIKGESTKAVQAAFGIDSEPRLRGALANDHVNINPAVVRAQSSALIIAEQADAGIQELAARMYAAWPMFGDVVEGLPLREYMREVDMGNDRDRFVEDASGLPVYEGRMVDAFDYRAKGYRSGRGRKAVWPSLSFADTDKSIQPQWHVPLDRVPNKARDRVNSYRVGFCDVVSPTNERSLMAALIPPGTIAGHKVPTFSYPDGSAWAYLLWLAVANSFTMDYLVRQKVATTMSLTVLDSLPFPRLPLDDLRVQTLCPLALRLSCTGPEMTDYWNAMSRHGWCQAIAPGEAPPGLITEDGRALARAQIDAVVARDLFGLSRTDLAQILDSFRTTQKYDEKRWGEYRSKRLIIASYDDDERGAVTPTILSHSGA